jgi:hypothetical protein
VDDYCAAVLNIDMDGLNLKIRVDGLTHLVEEFSPHNARGAA